MGQQKHQWQQLEKHMLVPSAAPSSSSSYIPEEKVTSSRLILSDSRHILDKTPTSSLPTYRTNYNSVTNNDKESQPSLSTSLPNRQGDKTSTTSSYSAYASLLDYAAGAAAGIATENAERGTPGPKKARIATVNAVTASGGGSGGSNGTSSTKTSSGNKRITVGNSSYTSSMSTKKRALDVLHQAAAVARVHNGDFRQDPSPTLSSSSAPSGGGVSGPLPADLLQQFSETALLIQRAARAG